MVQLRIRLEEKRKAIEAQKKKVEAAFTRHRQKMGHSAFLNMVKRKGDGAAILFIRQINSIFYCGGGCVTLERIFGSKSQYFFFFLCSQPVQT
uniref:Uncharacterized protein n=1 Tax=Cyprinodon variegatus TaxID=28743 RepID=A0A3Q2CXM5_CYPVA